MTRERERRDITDEIVHSWKIMGSWALTPVYLTPCTSHSLASSASFTHTHTHTQTPEREKKQSGSDVKENVRTEATCVNWCKERQLFTTLLFLPCTDLSSVLFQSIINL
jgi:hypothetical protein